MKNVNNVANAVNLSEGKYLEHEICACSGNRNNMWLVVYDGKYNYYLFNTGCNRVLWRYNKGWMPSNDIDRGTKETEFYSTFDNAVNNLVKVVANNGFLTRSRVIK